MKNNLQSRLLLITTLINMICIGGFLVKFSEPNENAQEIESYQERIVNIESENEELRQKCITLRKMLSEHSHREPSTYQIKEYKKEIDMLVKDNVIITASYDQLILCLKEKLASSSDNHLSESEIEFCIKSSQEESL
ncbi:MAG: hypothetical protein KDE26_03910 [Bacteroidetes bacterium]|nr:hypothetical protein [Bacteroidota bacterium]MCB0842394.1 hypothetical protein [Bacteroidota bacterium]